MISRLFVSATNAYRRVLALALRVAGPRVAYAYYRTMAGWFYRLFEPIRAHSERQCRAALGTRYPEEEVRAIARASFVHRSLNLADLMLADGRMHAGTYQHYGGRIPEPYLGLLQAARDQHRPVIFVTAYYGPFDLLPLLLGYNGFSAAAVYRRHADPRYDAYRTQVRTRSGCEAVPIESAAQRLPVVLEAGGAVAILSDHDVPRGVPVQFLGLPTTTSRAVGLLAVQHAAVVVVAALRRTDQPFRFEFVVEDFFDAAAWADAADPVVHVTQRYIAALERIVLADPAQYLWAHPRWRGENVKGDEASAPTPEGAGR
ncbi:MAG TPA: lysophospholipid acyltransferase family protein [Phycisphaerae bacterium]|nr:lysophospholipid acyltransferase family protein [Phycisphaerae bacterium]